LGHYIFNPRTENKTFDFVNLVGTLLLYPYLPPKRLVELTLSSPLWPPHPDDPILFSPGAGLDASQRPSRLTSCSGPSPPTPRSTIPPTFRPRAPQVSSNSPSLYLTPLAPTVMPSAHLCSPVTRAHRSVLAPLDARALLHHYPMPLEPAFTPLARPAPPSRASSP
jgi:hypothetical protein